MSVASFLEISRVAAIATAGLVLTSCASGTVMRWTGQNLMTGHGGAVRTIQGIDFYMSGQPNGTYRVLSIVAGQY